MVTGQVRDDEARTRRVVWDGEEGTDSMECVAC